MSITEPPTPADTQLAQEFLSHLAQVPASARTSIKVDVGDGEPPIPIPAAAFELLEQIMREMASGNTVAVTPIRAELTTQEAADLLGVSRPFIVERIDKGEIKASMAGTHRRVRIDDLMDYKRRSDAARRAAVVRLTELGEEIGE